MPYCGTRLARKVNASICRWFARAKYLALPVELKQALADDFSYLRTQLTLAVRIVNPRLVLALSAMQAVEPRPVAMLDAARHVVIVLAVSSVARLHLSFRVD